MIMHPRSKSRCSKIQLNRQDTEKDVEQKQNFYSQLQRAYTYELPINIHITDDDLWTSEGIIN